MKACINEYFLQLCQFVIKMHGNDFGGHQRIDNHRDLQPLKLLSDEFSTRRWSRLALLLFWFGAQGRGTGYKACVGCFTNLKHRSVNLG
jgi:hypothetical protein